jgi:predicted LPLAT superfamily acyltransferase
VVAAPMIDHERFRFETHGPITIGPGDAGIAAAMAGFAGVLESILRRYPTQWFNFYDIWPEG